MKQSLQRLKRAHNTLFRGVWRRFTGCFYGLNKNEARAEEIRLDAGWRTAWHRGDDQAEWKIWRQELPTAGIPTASPGANYYTYFLTKVKLILNNPTHLAA